MLTYTYIVRYEKKIDAGQLPGGYPPAVRSGRRRLRRLRRRGEAGRCGAGGGGGGGRDVVAVTRVFSKICPTEYGLMVYVYPVRGVRRVYVCVGPVPSCRRSAGRLLGPLKRYLPVPAAVRYVFPSGRRSRYYINCSGLSDTVFPKGGPGGGAVERKFGRKNVRVCSRVRVYLYVRRGFKISCRAIARSVSRGELSYWRLAGPD